MFPLTLWPAQMSLARLRRSFQIFTVCLSPLCLTILDTKSMTSSATRFTLLALCPRSVSERINGNQLDWIEPLSVHDVEHTSNFRLVLCFITWAHDLIPPHSFKRGFRKVPSVRLGRVVKVVSLHSWSADGWWWSAYLWLGDLTDKSVMRYIPPN